MFGSPYLGASSPQNGGAKPNASYLVLPNYWGGGAAEEPVYEQPNWGGGGPTGPVDGLFDNIPQATPGPELDPQMVEVAPPKMPDVMRAGLNGASAAATGWQAQPVQQAATGDIGKRIYPPGGTALTQRGRVY